LADQAKAQSSIARSLMTLAMVNAGIWAISIIALVFVIQHSPAAKGLFPILGGGTAVAVSMISLVTRQTSGAD